MSARPNLPSLTICFLGFLSVVLHADADADSDPLTFERCVQSSLFVSEVFCLPADYRKDRPPTTDTPTNVYINLPLSEISKIDDKHSQISLRLSYKLLWPEPRMVLNSSANWTNGEISVGASLIKHFWTPDLIIHDLVKFYKPTVITEVAALEIKLENSVYYKVRSDLTIVCKGMNFALYPFDRHVCHLKLTSFGHANDKMILNGGFTYKHSNQRALPFRVNIMETGGSSSVYHGHNSNYSMYALQIHLTRVVTPYLLSTYIPTGIFVIVSWLSFIIPADIIAARVVLLVTLCLVLINMFNKVTENIPNARQETAVEFWVSGCIGLVFAALAEYAFILWKMVRLRRRRRRQLEVNQARKRRKASAAAEDGKADRAESGHGHGHNGEPSSTPVNGVPTSSGHYQAESGKGGRGKRRAAAGTRGSGWVEAHPLTDKLNVHVHADAGDSYCDNLDSLGDDDGFCEDQYQAKVIKYQERYDQQALYVYPSIFVLFNVGYWLYYLVYSRNNDKWPGSNGESSA